jgi:hypothetical protein
MIQAIYSQGIFTLTEEPLVALTKEALRNKERASYSARLAA